MKRVAFVALAAVLLYGGQGGGIRPRPSSADYPAHQDGKGITIAAAAILPDQATRLFGADLNHAGYMVFEVAVFPETGDQIELANRDFLLRAGSDPATIRTVSPQAVAAYFEPKYNTKPKPPGNVSIYPTGTIGYESGTYNGQRRGGVYTGGGVGVGVGDPGPTMPPAPPGGRVDGASVRQELEDLALPQGKTNEAVAGYLYFPKPAKSAKSYTLTFYGPDGQVNVVIPQARK